MMDDKSTSEALEIVKDSRATRSSMEHSSRAIEGHDGTRMEEFQETRGKKEVPSPRFVIPPLNGDCIKDQKPKQNDFTNVEIIETSSSEDSSSSDNNSNSMATSDENIIHKKKKDKKELKVGVFQLFKFSSKADRVLLLLGIIFAMLHGIALQCPYIFMSQVIDKYAELLQMPEQNSTNTTDSDIYGAEGKALSIWIIIRLVGCMCVISTSVFLQFFCFTLIANRVARRVRHAAFSNILRQHMGYFDKHTGGELNTRLTQDMIKFEVGIGGKFSLTVSYLTCFISGLIICMINGWILTLFMCVLLPAAGIVSGITTRFMKIYSQNEMNAYAAAGKVAEEALTNIRVVTAFAGQNKESERYAASLTDAKAVSVKSAVASAIGQGVPWLMTFTITAVTAYFGGKLVNEDRVRASFIVLLLTCMMQGLRALGFSALFLENISDAQSAAFGIYEIIFQKTEIDSMDKEGGRPSNCEGLVTFEGIHFEYPARQNVPVLKGLSLTIKPGQSAALVGPSGCGKSTTIQLIQRFYDPREGIVYLDGNDIRNLNIQWLRQQIGVVSQEPVLFATSIEENIRFGRDDVTYDEIIAAAREADAHDFIERLPNKYATELNEQGTELSRGEKQRISLARALVRNPKILLLDECTSALDNESEKTVQAALDKAAKGRTTIIIAHRLSTIRNCDVIFVVNDGIVQEKGSHEELFKEGGLYYSLASAQILDHKESQEADIENIEDIKLDDVNVNAKTFQRSRSRNSLRSSVRSIISNILLNKDDSDQMEKETGKQEEEEEEEERGSLMQVFCLNAKQFPILLLGAMGGLALGCAYPIFSILFSNIIGELITKNIDMRVVLEMSLGMLLLGAAACVIAIISVFLLRMFGENLAFKTRCLSYASMLKQEIGWFDVSSNQVGALTTRLADESSRIKLATGSTFLYLVSAISNVCCAIAISVIYSWRLGLVLLPIMPFAIIAGVVQGYMNTTFERNSHRSTAASGKVASEAIDKIRTLASLTKEQFFLNKYISSFDTIKREARRRGVIIGGSWIFLYISILSIEIVILGYGLYLVQERLMEFKNIFRLLVVAIIMVVEVGRANANIPELTSSRAAASSLLKLVQRQSAIDPKDTTGFMPETCKGEVSLSDVTFRYPTRPRVTVLRHMTVKAERGQTVAVVGPSGGGKSTIIQLIERFYDVFSGSVKVDGVDVKDLNLDWLRAQIGVVLQEPILFAISIADNIAYGDNSRYVTMDEVIDAAKSANIHSFISTLPEGYETNVGNKGTQLSGGQKQRISIARALLRHPKILLLDDATSALDSQSEAVVEEALSTARTGRTCIIIAHRLSSVVHSDVILYVHHGHVLEQGTHDQLMSKRGHYYSLFMANQMSSK